MGRKNSNVKPGYKCAERHYSRRHHKFKRFKTFEKRCQEEAIFLEFLEARAAKKLKKRKKKAARAFAKKSKKGRQQPHVLILELE